MDIDIMCRKCRATFPNDKLPDHDCITHLSKRISTLSSHPCTFLQFLTNGVFRSVYKLQLVVSNCRNSRRGQVV